MITTVNLIELQQLVNSNHTDPHYILGMHLLESPKESFVTVRAFIPEALEITVIDCADTSHRYKLSLIHDDGFFEVKIKDRNELFQYQLEIQWPGGGIWTTYDPYSFMPLISEIDLYLFGEGTHYKIYNKLGAHPMTVDGVEGVSFAVWAPNVARCSVIGDFNNWDGRRNQMRKLYKSGVWEIFIPGLKANDKYKYELREHSGSLIQKSDPYGNFAELRPSTTSLVYNDKHYTWKDQRWLSQLKKETFLKKPVNIYEVHLGYWKKTELESDPFPTYVALADKLIPYVKGMGYTHIELMPIQEHPSDGSLGYQVTGYYAPTSRYGTPDEFKYFIDTCHQNNIGVILDWVPAHFPKDAHGLGRFDGTALYEHEDPRKGEYPDQGTYIFNFGRKEVKNFLIANALFWIEKYHIDGLRVDAVASMLYLDYGKGAGQWIPNHYGNNENLDAVEFMKHMNSIMLAKHPHVMMIADEPTSWPGVSKPVEEGGLGFNLKWNKGWMNNLLDYAPIDSINSIDKNHHLNHLAFDMVSAYKENFVLALPHDAEIHGKTTPQSKIPDDLMEPFANLRAAYGFMYGYPGKKLLCMGREFGQFAEWNEKKGLDWFLLDLDYHKQMKKFIQDLNHFYKEDMPSWYDDFNTNGFEWLACDDTDQSVVSFLRKGKKANDLTIYICNLTPVAHTALRVGVPAKGKYQEVLNSDKEKYGGTGVVNTRIMEAEKKPCHNRAYSISIQCPPLGVSIIKPAKR